MICPICGKEFTGPPAVSRTDNKTLICPRDGTREALTAAGFLPEKIEEILDDIYGNDG